MAIAHQLYIKIPAPVLRITSRVALASITYGCNGEQLIERARERSRTTALSLSDAVDAEIDIARAAAAERWRKAGSQLSSIARLLGGHRRSDHAPTGHAIDLSRQAGARFRDQLAVDRIRRSLDRDCSKLERRIDYLHQRAEARLDRIAEDFRRDWPLG